MCDYIAAALKARRGRHAYRASGISKWRLYITCCTNVLLHSTPSTVSPQLARIRYRVNSVCFVTRHFASGRRAKYCGESVCLSVCLSVHSHNSKTTPPKFAQFLCVLPYGVARSSSGGVAIRYVLPVLWITSCFHIMILLRVMCIPSSDITTSITGQISTKLCTTIKTSYQLLIVSRPPVRTLLSTIVL